MPHPRASSHTRARQISTTASPSSGSGCASGLLLPPLAVLLVGFLLFIFVNHNIAVPDSVHAASPQTLTTLSSIFTPEIQYWGGQILAWSADFGLDPNLTATVMQIESCGDPHARSSAGALGLFQVMPYHFYALDDPFNPDTNAARGLTYLVHSLERAGGDVRQALAGYNGGVGLIGSAEWTWPAETKRYVYFGGQIYEDAQAGLDSSNRLTEWFNRYGVGLCAQARQRQ